MGGRLVRIEEAVISLHNIARWVERSYGSGALASDIRKTADRLNALDELDYQERMRERYNDGDNGC
jgi:hypothetical protein